MNKNLALYLSQPVNTDFPVVLDQVQTYISEKFKELLNGKQQDSKPLLLSHIKKYLVENKLAVEGMDNEQLINRIYTEMAEFSFLTPYLNFSVENVEGIEINSWQDIKVKYSDGRYERAKGHFLSPSHAKNVMERLLRQSGITMDYTRPLVRGHLGKNIRITVNGGGGTLDEDVGIAASIRFINPSHLTREDMIRFGTINSEMMDFLCAAYRYGLSMMAAGETDAGKTTFISILMAAAVPNDKKLYTIENGTREFDLVKHDGNDQITNNVVHTVTRDTDDPITQQMLLEQGMTMNPDYICMAEVKGSEAFETTEAALTGHPVIGTTHTDCAANIPDRLVQLASIKSSTLTDKTLYSMVVKAFPILFFAEKMADGKRRITEICECQLEDDKPKVIPLWQYKTDYNEEINGKTIVHGNFVKCNIISSQLQTKLLRKGIPKDILQSFVEEE